ncbi:hypothetical protein LAZ67_17001196 [Cordylochernes scorpioides]|uniref:Reverse transcriptase domain-containing protein n=1 Tax=Cordylochernes scorpioides TaxID=51811 RepID=A0ABY6LEJ7_9ARAC|nr:hypothetical protein LAZ67_17001196 [Cordylochernes scorpioides]
MEVSPALQPNMQGPPVHPTVPPNQRPEFTEVIMSITRDIQRKEKILTDRQQTKMSYWVKKYQFPQSAAFPSNSSNGIVNLSSMPLTEKEERMLALGLHYVPPDKPDIPRLIAGVEGALKNLNHMETLRIRHAVTQVLRRPYHPVSYTRDHRSLILKLKKTSSLVITKADKGNQTVLMDRADYEGKMMNILADTSTFTNIPTSAKDAMVKGYKSSLRNLMKAKLITKEQFTQFTGSLTRDAYIYGAPKIHKSGVPLRPIIAYHLSPAYTLAKYLAQLLSPIMKSNPNQYNITHPPSFIQEITQMQLPAHHTMVSFDVTALYLSLPHTLILNKLQSFLKSAGIQDQTITLITQLTSLCLSISTFTFNHQHYKQIRGTPMGSPLSSIVAEVVMGSLDRWINQTHSSDIHYWRRTNSRRLGANGLHSCRPLRRLPLTPPNRRQRLEWCRARSTWMTEWHRVVFSDESRFCLSSDSRRVRVWRRRGERSNPAAIVERPTVRQRGIMVWGAIAYDSRSPLLRIQGTMTAQRYVDDVLRPVTLPYLQGVPNALYQQDNARPHTARISQQALQDVQMLPWPPYSPDLSPIEHVWDIIGRRLHALPQPRSEDELWQMEKPPKKTTAIFLYMTSAFDRVWREKLREKLHNIGVRRKTLIWIADFLRGRRLKVRVNGEFSKEGRTWTGVTQGSVLSPLLYLLYINDIYPYLTEDTMDAYYADDIAIWYTSSSIEKS